MPVLRRKSQPIETREFDGTAKTGLNVVRWLRGLGVKARYYIDENLVRTNLGAAEPGDHVTQEGRVLSAQEIIDEFDVSL